MSAGSGKIAGRVNLTAGDVLAQELGRAGDVSIAAGSARLGASDGGGGNVSIAAGDDRTALNPDALGSAGGGSMA